VHSTDLDVLGKLDAVVDTDDGTSTDILATLCPAGAPLNNSQESPAFVIPRGLFSCATELLD